MRFLLKVNIPVESGNAAAKAGKLGATIQTILTDLKPEAVYFTDSNGQRTAFIVLDMQDVSQIPSIAEPWFLAFNASIEIHPVMIPDDLAKAGGAIENAVKKYA
jgi:hypothetical protein